MILQFASGLRFQRWMHMTSVVQLKLFPLEMMKISEGHSLGDDEMIASAAGLCYLLTGCGGTTRAEDLWVGWNFHLDFMVILYDSTGEMKTFCWQGMPMDAYFWINKTTEGLKRILFWGF
jgi:hypothetical protein